MIMKIERYPAYKDSGIEWLGAVPEHWEVRRLKDINTVIMGQSPSSSEYADQDMGYPFLQGNAEFGNYYPTPKIWSMEIKKKVVKNDILLSVRAPVGAVNVALECYGIGRGLCAIRSKNNYQFWYYLIISVKPYLNSIATGSTYLAVSVEDVKNISIVLPPLFEQKAIANYLDTKTSQIDRRIDLLTEKAKLYNNLKQSLINETVTRGLDKSVPMKNSEYEWDQKIPKHWQEIRVKNIFKLITDLAPNNNDFELLSLYASIGVRPRKDMEQRGNKSVTTDGYWMVKKGDIIVNKLLAWMGSIGLSEYDGVTSPAYDILRKSNENTDQRFYTYLFRTEKAQAIFKKQSRGIMDVRLRLYFDKFGAISVPFPPPDEQKAIAHYLDTKTSQIDKIIETINTQIEKLKELRKTLINDVVTGKIKVV
jgi:type I restriction enzyme S subunit